MPTEPTIPNIQLVSGDDVGANADDGDDYASSLALTSRRKDRLGRPLYRISVLLIEEHLAILDKLVTSNDCASRSEVLRRLLAQDEALWKE